ARGPARRTQRRDRRHRPHRGRPAPRPGSRPRPRRGRTDGAPAGLQAHGLRQVQVRERAEGPRGAPEPDQRDHQGDEAPPEDRLARLRDQEGSRRAVPQGGRQGEDHDHVPRPRAAPSR
ncbi:MAG: Translation initiation factor 3, partial [uncultured Nocardioidaceae bacterium]